MYKIYFSLILSFLIFMQAAESQVTGLPDMFYGNEPYSYSADTAEPDAGWNLPGFDDSTWLKGHKSIGYGDNDDTTHIDTTTSVYIRTSFQLEDKTVLKRANLMVDFDDGFIAYLNGNEIARVNLGTWGEFVPHDRLTDRSHEAYIYRFYFRPILGYYLCNDTLAKYLVDGENILAFQVHNDSTVGSDLSFKARLLDLTNETYDQYWDQSRYIKQVPLDSTDFPIIMINTDENGIPNHHVRYRALMEIIDGVVNRPSDSASGYCGNISIEIRGKSSKDFPKKSYNVETQDSLGNNLNVSLLGMPPENDWILYGPFVDKSLIRNELCFMLGRKTGRYQPRTRFCELIMNGENHGLYVLTEKIKRDSNRVDISKLKDTDLSGDDLTGGYLFTLEFGDLGIRYPEDDDIRPEQLAYIEGFYQEFLDVLDSPDLSDPVRGYRKYIDEQSLIDFIILNEAVKNCDAYYLSDYAYKDRDDKDGRIKYGPLWDNDLAIGNAYFQNGYLTTGWQFEENTYLQLTKIMRDTSFTRQLADKWHDLRETGFLHTDSLMYYIDSLVTSISVARLRNYEIWPVIDKRLFGQQEEYVNHSYDEEIQYLKSFLNERTNWVDENISKIFYEMPSIMPGITIENSYSFYPNPFSDRLSIVLMTADAGTYTVEIFDLTGRKVFASEYTMAGHGEMMIQLNNHILSDLAPGVYAIRITNDKTVIVLEKITKK